MDWMNVVNTAGLVVVAYLGYLNNRAVKEVHLLINSRITELLELTRTSAMAEGALKERDKASDKP